MVWNAVDLALLQNYTEFKTYVMEENSMIAEWRIHALGNLLELMKNSNKELGGKEDVKDECLKLWGIPIKRPATAARARYGYGDKPVPVEEKEDEKDEFIVRACLKYGIW
ncbi:MAG: hypothetical protein P4M11_08685 [Candidatus Pacebacteria bacterium]|nr:hypothetical protein [Candidatus Paceibacterota bacterium]